MTDFEWDPRKADANFEKHGVDFMEAIGLFAAPHFTYPSRHEGGCGSSARASWTTGS